MDIPHLFIHPSVHGHLGYFQLLSTMNNAAVNIHIQLFLWTYVFISFWHIPKSRILGSYSNFVFNHLGNGQTVFQSSRTSVRPEQQYMKILISVHIHQRLL